MNPSFQKTFSDLESFDAPRLRTFPDLPRHLAWENGFILRNCNEIPSRYRPLTTIEAWAWHNITRCRQMLNALYKGSRAWVYEFDDYAVCLEALVRLNDANRFYSSPLGEAHESLAITAAKIPPILLDRKALVTFLKKYNIHPPRSIFSPSASFVAEDTSNYNPRN